MCVLTDDLIETVKGMCVSTDDLKNNLELGNLVDTFREHAVELVNMLDVSVPVVAKLKVYTLHTLLFKASVSVA